MQFNADGTTTELTGEDPVVTELLDSKLMVEWPLKQDFGTLRILFSEKAIEVSRRGGKRSQKWVLELRTSSRASLPFAEITDHLIKAVHSQFPFEVTVTPGLVSAAPAGSSDYVFRIAPEKERILIQTHP